MRKMSGIDWGSFRERSDDPEIRNLYHSSPTNFPHPIDVFPELKDAFDNDAMVSLANQAKTGLSASLLPIGGTGFLGNAAVAAGIAGLNSDADTLPGMLKDMGVAGAVGGTVAVAAPVVAREVSSNVRHLFGKTPKVTIPMGPRGARRVLSEISPQRYRQSLIATRGSEIDPRAPVLHDVWRNRMNIPGETSRFSSIEVPLSARGRVMLNADASYLDRVYAAIRNSSSLEPSRFGAKVDTIFKNSPEKATISTAYPRWLQTTRIKQSRNLPPDTLGSATRFRYSSESAALANRDMEYLVELRRARAFKGDMLSTTSHEIKHSLETREPFLLSEGGRLGYDPVAFGAARRRIALMFEEGAGASELAGKYHSVLTDELYRSQINENTARLYGLLNRYGVRNMNALKRAVQASGGSGASGTRSWGTDTIGRPFIQHPESQSLPVYLRAGDLQHGSVDADLMPATRLDAKGGKSGAVRMDSKGGRQQPAYRWEDGDGKPEKLPEGKTNQWGGTLRNEGRKPYLHRNSDGKITHYGTTRSTVVKDGGAFYVVPTLFNGEDIMDAKVGPDGKVIRTAHDKNDFDEMDRRALQRMKDTGEYWAKFDNVDDARDFASGRGKFTNDGPHATQQAEMQKEWNKFILRNWDQMSDEYRNDADLSRAREEWESGKDVFGDGSTLRQDSKGGNAIHADLEGGESTEESVNSVNEVPEGTEQTVQNNGGPRIIVNPKVFSDKRDALCVAMNEAFRILMEVNGFEPQAEPTPAQRRFFADTAYANDELMLRRTILARICTFDTSIGGPSSGEHTGHSESTAPTDEQLQEAVEFLETVTEIGAPQNQWEQQAVQRIHDVLVKAVESGVKPVEGAQPEPPSDSEGTVQGAVGAGMTEYRPGFHGTSNKRIGSMIGDTRLGGFDGSWSKSMYTKDSRVFTGGDKVFATDRNVFRDPYQVTARSPLTVDTPEDSMV